jgi:hypothetical protein
MKADLFDFSLLFDGLQQRKGTHSMINRNSETNPLLYFFDASMALIFHTLKYARHTRLTAWVLKWKGHV